eukprot:7352555-Lingulodinium_polyedra.AAC.1
MRAPGRAAQAAELATTMFISVLSSPIPRASHSELRFCGPCVLAEDVHLEVRPQFGRRPGHFWRG